MSVQDNIAAVRDFIERGWNAGEESVFDEHFAADFDYPGGRDGFKSMVLAARAAFPDLAMEVNDMLGSGDKVVTRFTIRGTHQGEFLGVAPTGRRIEVGGMAIDVMRDGQRVAGWGEWDRLGLLVQLGAADAAAFR
jgi:predicted ester cyclase